MITHHVVKGFNYAKMRKTDFIDVEAQKENNKEYFNDYENRKVPLRSKYSGCDHSTSKSEEK